MTSTLAVGCSYCHAQPNEACVNLVTGQPIKHFEAHACRIALAHPELKQEAKPEEEWWQK